MHTDCAHLIYLNVAIVEFVGTGELFKVLSIRFDRLWHARGLWEPRAIDDIQP